MSILLEITKDNFDQEVLQSDLPVFVDFWGDSCAPCKRMTPIIEELVEENKEFKFCKINVQEYADAAIKYNVRSIPTFMIFKNGSPTKNIMYGSTSKVNLQNFIDHYILD